MLLLSLFTTLVGRPFIASAHVGYVVTADQMHRAAGADWQYFFSVFSKGSNIVLMLVTILIVAGLMYYIPKTKVWRAFVKHIEKHLASYQEFLPWMARLSIGIALMGAGTASVFFSPTVPAFAPIPFFLILTGFFYLIGFLLIPTTVFIIVLFLVALSGHAYLIGNLDLLALLFAFLALHDERPGVDHIFGIRVLTILKLPREWAPLILRAGIGIAMIFLALYEKILNPHFSRLVVDQYVLTDVVHVSSQMWVFGAGMIELVVGLCLLLGLYTRLVSVVAFLILSLSFFFFKEAVYSHVTLFGLLSMLLVLGGGKWSLDARRAPILPKVKKAVKRVVRRTRV
jgi:uncharacterized membrane protein YphA (DoxX/SURF4 family)